MVHRRKQNSALNCTGFSVNGLSENFSDGCGKEREMSPSHLNSGHKDTESAKVLLLNCWCVILTGEKTCWYVNKSLCVVS